MLLYNQLNCLWVHKSALPGEIIIFPSAEGISGHREKLLDMAVHLLLTSAEVSNSDYITICSTHFLSLSNFLPFHLLNIQKSSRLSWICFLCYISNYDLLGLTAVIFKLLNSPYGAFAFCNLHQKLFWAFLTSLPNNNTVYQLRNI